jgi:formate hydrogenlyase transcriptional activator
MSTADLWERIRSSCSPWLRTWPGRYAFAVLAVGVATALQMGLRQLGLVHLTFILFYPTVVLVAMHAGLGPGILATVLAAVSGGYFFLEPTYSFVVRTPEDLLDPTLFAFIAVSLTLLTYSRNRARQALSVSETDLNRAQAAAHIGSWRCDLQERSLALSEEAYRILGLSPGSYITLDRGMESIHAEDRERVREAFRAALARGAYEVETRVWVEGCARWVSVLANIETDAAGQPVAAVGTVQDITERKLAQERLQEFERVVEGLEELILVVDRDYRYVLANRAFLKGRGIEREQLVGRRLAELMGADLFEETVKPKLEECFQGKVVNYEKRYQYPSLGERDLSVSYFPLTGPSGVDRVAVLMRDVTEKKRAAEALRESEDRYRDLVEHSEDLVCTHDLEGNLLSVNPAPARILGYSVEELLRIPMRDLIIPEGRPLFDQYLERFRTTGQPEHGLLCVITKSGEVRTWEYSNTLRTEGVEKPVVRGMAHDVTERRRAELALRQREEDYRRFVAQSSEGIFRQDLDEPVPIDLPEDELVQRILHGSYMAECNEAFVKMYGLNSVQDCVGKRLTETLDPNDPRNIELTREFVRSGFRVLERESHEVDVHGNPKVFRNSMIGIVEGGKLLRTWGIQRDVTEQVKADEGRRKAEAALRDLVADVDGIVWEAEAETFRFTFVNQQAERVLGYPLAQWFQPGFWADHLHPDDRTSAVEFCQQAAREKQKHDFEYRMIAADGRTVWLRDIVSVVTDPQGSVRLRGIMVDITRQKQIEKALQASEAHFRILVEQASDGIFIIDTEGRCLDANSAGADMFGYTWEEILGMSLPDVVAPEELGRIPFELARLGSGEVVRTEANFRRKDGSVFRGEVSGKRLPDGRIQGILRDITERVRAEEIMRQSEERFRVALKDSPTTVFSQDRDLRCTWVYNAPPEWPSEVLGKTCGEVIGAKNAERLHELGHQVLETGQGLREEITIARNGNRWVFDATLEPLHDSTGAIAGITGSLVDIARLRELADGLMEAKDKLVREKHYLESEIEDQCGFEKIIGQSPALQEVLKQVRVVAPTDSTVLLLGETGTGKELVARAIHSLSARHDKNFIKLNCAAVPTGLLESELFGHEKGAFTGAVSQKIGRLELADKGTVFLDEIGELPLELQPKLLRVLQDREFERLGGVRTLRVDVRVISATNRDLRKDVAEKRFREDLFYRLNVFPIPLPALRERRSDIPILVRHFVGKHAARMGKRIETIPHETVEVLKNWSWPGNIRELENLIERMVILSKGRVLSAPPVELEGPQDMPDDDLTEMEREHIIRVLRETNGVLSGRDGAASRLGIKRTTLQSMLKRLGIEPQEFRRGTGTFGRE